MVNPLALTVSPIPASRTYRYYWIGFAEETVRKYGFGFVFENQCPTILAVNFQNILRIIKEADHESDVLRVVSSNSNPLYKHVHSKCNKK
ncbi:unnamed protein product [Allacma fusca]|uniref:Uncharacterized protein n=1 Tax=Allacma fusca TaxID=39272 RepID=A0A8J2NRJ8_9HEXA|nr:unnamed protein product [Allacma fusca]